MLFSLVAPQFDHHHLLCCLDVRRILRRGHLRDGLRHLLLLHLHDGLGQAVPSGQLGLECESPACGVFRRTRVHRFTTFHHVSSSLQDLFRAGIGAALYIITSLITVIGGAGDGARIAGGVSDRWKCVSVCMLLIVGAGN